MNPGFADDNGECFSPATTAQITGWNHEYFALGEGVTQSFPENQPWPSCAARTKGELHEAQESAQGSIPEGETGKLWQIVAVPAYSEIIWKDARMEHEDGDVFHRLYGCSSPSATGCRLIAETTSTIPQVSDKGACDAYVQIITVDALGGISIAEYADPEAGCPLENLPDPVSFSAKFGEWPYLMVEVEIHPLPDGEGQSGYKAGWWSLEVVE